MSKCTPAYSVFKGRNRDLELLFSPAKRPGKVMCVAMDYAKAANAVLIANDEGMQLSPMLEVRNDRKGVEFLLAQARKAARKYGISDRHICVGGEDCGVFAANFIHALKVSGYLVIGVNPKDAKEQRGNFRASTDKLDTPGILKMLMDRPYGGDQPDSYAGGSALSGLFEG